MKARQLIDAGEIGKPQQIRQRFGAWVERAGVLDDRREVTDQHRGWRMDLKSGRRGFSVDVRSLRALFRDRQISDERVQIKEVYSLKSDISWMHDTTKHALDRANMNIYRPERVGDIPIMTWSYEDPACQGLWMRRSC